MGLEGATLLYASFFYPKEMYRVSCPFMFFAIPFQEVYCEGDLCHASGPRGLVGRQDPDFHRNYDRKNLHRTDGRLA